MRRHEADALEPGHGVEAREELGERGRARLPAAPEVAPVGVDVLAEQGHLAHAVGDQRLGLRDQVLDRPAALGAADVRDDAVGAEVGAAAHDLQPRLERALAAGSEAAAEVRAVLEVAGGARVRRLHGGPQQLRQPVQVLRAEGAVDEREAREEARLLRLRQAAGHEDHARGVLALEPRRRAEVAGEAVVRALAHRAGVVDEHVSAVGLVGALQALGLEQRADALGVVLVHLAAERAQVVTAGHDGLVALAGRRRRPATWRCRRRGSRG